MLTAGSVARARRRAGRLGRSGQQPGLRRRRRATSPISAAARCRCGHRTAGGGCRWPGWDGACEWTSTVPFAWLPRTVDPAAGYVMTANNAIIDGGRALPVVHVRAAVPGRAAAVAARRRGRGRPRTSWPRCRRTRCPCAARGMGPGARLGSGRSRIPGRRGGAGAAGRIRRGPRGRVGGGAAVRVLPPGARGGAVPAGPRRRRPGRGSPRARSRRRCPWSGGGSATTPGSCSAVPVPPVAVPAARDRTRVGGGGRRERAGRRVLAAVPGALAAAWAAAVRPAGAGPRAVAVGRRAPRGPGAPARAAEGGPSPARRWAATPTPSRPPATAGGRAARSPSTSPVGVPAGGGPRRPQRRRAS